jgi:hypothetical protein
VTVLARPLPANIKGALMPAGLCLVAVALLLL